MIDVYLITASWIKSSKSLESKFNSLKNEFTTLNFHKLDYDINNEQVQKISNNGLHTLPSWVILEEKSLTIMSGDVLIKPLRHFLKGLL